MSFLGESDKGNQVSNTFNGNMSPIKMSLLMLTTLIKLMILHH